MSPSSLSVLAEEQLALARATNNGRSARTVHGGSASTLRQTLIALVAGHALEEHASPGDATLQVLRGRVRLVAQDQSWPGAAGDLLVIPDARHALHADEDAVVLLTVAR
ncbi:MULTISPECIES: cupin domain-containing protein [Micromonospora]|uniref:LuxR family transcriptional regulator n=1 Tax=Micromonospora solifontis TaxID=2487138 RepID=A0ABX9WIB1_9ACTN|nr:MULTISPECIES: cupin domain-containing protein [Micromonospora]NES15553.1 LuxR family transcriptional regulator [Micromonospora sp. PPF5-17B]NES36877.1 LuxR family transcriptional regulator [Micromonospora solifontis]NES55220.1 LuxR family transcriptional regulator [Micromonospora sp. PPF5-6]RNL98929.1 LuxR family transcriptional regulator [Micromonospora solifontis]